MPAEPVSDDPFAPVDVKLKAPGLAALLAWSWPGAGHLYQGRTGKGLLFMICILFTYFWGLAIGGGHVVYASFERPAIRYPYIFQLGVGIPALPAAIQAMGDKPVLGTKFMAPPAGPVQESRHDELASWHDETGFFFELGTLYTMIAGLLNVLVIYDAYSGPVFIRPGQHGKKEKAKPKTTRPGRNISQCESILMDNLILFAEINRMWHAVPLIIAISLVYGATRHELPRPILEHALRFGWWIVSFMAILFVVLWFWTRNL